MMNSGTLLLRPWHLRQARPLGDNGLWFRVVYRSAVGVEHFNVQALNVNFARLKAVVKVGNNAIVSVEPTAAPHAVA